MKKNLLHLIAASVLCFIAGFICIVALASMEDDNLKEEMIDNMTSSVFTGMYDDSCTNLDMGVFLLMQNRLSK